MSFIKTMCKIKSSREGGHTMAEVSHNTPRQSLAALRAGQEALDQGAWKRACTCFQEALGQEETPEAFEGLGMASWWLDDATTMFDVRLRAYRLYRHLARMGLYGFS